MTRLRASIHLGEQETSGNVQVGRHQQQLVQQLVQAGGVETIGALEFARCGTRPPCTCVDKLVRETQCVSLGFVTHQTQICHHMLGFVRQQTQICHRIHQLLVRLLNDSTIARKSLFQEKKIKVCQNCSKALQFVLDLNKYFLPGKEYFLSETAFLPSVNIDEVVSVRI